MATYTNQILVYVDGRTQKISSSDALVIGGAFTAASFSGDGSALTSLNASNVSSGTLADARLSSNVALYDAAAPTFTNTVSAAGFSGSGASLTSLNASNVSSGTLADARLSSNVPLKDAVSNSFSGSITASSFSGDGSALTSLNGSNVSSGTVADARLSSNVALYDAATPTFTNTVAAAGFSGSGASLTSLNASNVSSGTLNDGRLSSNVALYDAAAPNFTNTVTAAGFSGDGSALTNLNGSNITTGTVADARLSSNVPLKDAASNAFSGSMSIGGDLVVSGDIISAGAQSVIIGDNFLDLNAGNTVTASAMAGGLSVNVQAVGTAFTATDFTAGVAGVSNPVITVSADPTGDFYDGDLIQVSGSADSKNDGQYVVLATSSTTITIKGIGITAPAGWVPFVHNQFVAQTSQTATITKANFSVLAASNGTIGSTSGLIPTGRWAQASGTTETDFDGTWIPTDPNAAVTLQSAYNNGSNIQMQSGRSFSVAPETGAAAGFELTGSATSSINTTGGAGLYIGSNAGNLEISGAHIAFRDGNVSNDKAMLAPMGGGTSAVAEGDICYIDEFGAAALSDASAVSYAEREVDGVMSDVTSYFASYAGSKVLVKVAGTAANAGEMLYLSSTPGQATTTMPTSGRVTRLGKCVQPGSGVCYVLWNPQYVCDL